MVYSEMFQTEDGNLTETGVYGTLNHPGRLMYIYHYYRG